MTQRMTYIARFIVTLIIISVFIVGFSTFHPSVSRAVLKQAPNTTSTSSAGISNRTSNTAKDRKRIRVGVFPSLGWSHYDSTHGLLGYGADYLQALARYGNWGYEFVDGSFVECEQLLVDGKIDLLGLMVYSPERAQVYSFPSYPAGTTAASLFTLRTSPIAFEDYKGFNQKTIGFIRGSSALSIIANNAEQYGYSYTTKLYDNEYELRSALTHDEVDLVGIQSASGFPGNDGKLVLECTPMPYYFVTSKSNPELGRELNSAMRKLHEANPTYNESLESKYIRSQAAYLPSYSVEELQYLKTRPVLKIAYVKGRLPIEGATSEDISGAKGPIAGISGDFLAQIERQTGIRFLPIEKNTDTEANQALVRGEVDMVASFCSKSSEDSGLPLAATRPYLSNPFVLLTTGVSSIRKRPITAVPQYAKWITKADTPGADQTDYAIIPDTSEAISRLKANKVDFVIEDSQIAAAITQDPANDSVEIARISSLSHDVGFGFRTDADMPAMSIFNKVIESMPDEDKASIYLSHSLGTEKPYSLSKVLLTYWPYILLLIVSGSTFTLALINSQRKKNIKTVERLAYVDPVTGLANRNKFIAEFNQILDDKNPTGWTLVSLDIDSFKSINDIYGMNFGNALLKHLGSLLAGSLPEGIVARDSADNFLLLVPHNPAQSLADELNDVVGSISNIHFKQAGELDLSVSAGVYSVGSRDRDPESLINKADMARISIKADHSTQLMYFTENMRAELADEALLENDLKHSFARDELELYYQPKVQLSTGRVLSFEALIRWNHPTLGILTPGLFIPLAERLGLITQVTCWVVDRVCEDMSSITRRLKTEENLASSDGLSLKASFNLSQNDLVNPNFVTLLTNAINRNMIHPTALELEITEGAVFDNRDIALDTLNKIADLGIAISLDDFGTGYSSLGHLKSLPLSEVKLDKVFVDDIESDERGKQMVSDIIVLIKTLGYQVVAEGVETQAQAEYLKLSGCDVAQGYHYARPMPKDEAYDYYLQNLQGLANPDVHTGTIESCTS